VSEHVQTRIRLCDIHIEYESESERARGEERIEGEAEHTGTDMQRRFEEVKKLKSGPRERIQFQLVLRGFQAEKNVARALSFTQKNSSTTHPELYGDRNKSENPPGKNMEFERYVPIAFRSKALLAFFVSFTMGYDRRCEEKARRERRYVASISCFC
jgi:hypothetical protein